MPLAAIVLYSFDLSLLDPTAPRENNFYFRLNKVMQERNPVKIKKCEPYLYYLMKGLEALPPVGADVIVWRGVSREGRDELLKHYIMGRRVHWSSFSSATLERKVAEEFAGTGGVLLQIQLLPNVSRSRNISELSAIRSEREVVLLPNFCVTVTRALNRVDGFDVITLLEQSDVVDYKF
jgi:hypothetical protein